MTNNVALEIIEISTGQTNTPMTATMEKYVKLDSLQVWLDAFVENIGPDDRDRTLDWPIECLREAIKEA